MLHVTAVLVNVNPCYSLILNKPIRIIATYKHACLDVNTGAAAAFHVLILLNIHLLEVGSFLWPVTHAVPLVSLASSYRTMSGLGCPVLYV